jgi:hypothetical protein
VFTAAPDCTETGVDERIVNHTCARLFTVVQTGLSSQLSSIAGEGDPPNFA